MNDLVHSEIVMRSAEGRLDRAISEFKRQVFGDEHYLEELHQSDTIDRTMRHGAPPETPTALDPVRRHNWARRLLGPR